MRRLRLSFPTTLSAFHDRNTPEGITTHPPSSSELSCQRRSVITRSTDARAVINLARKFDLVGLLPSAFYVCATLPIDALLGNVSSNGSHDYLSPSDLRLCFRLRDALFEQCSHQLSFLFEYDSPTHHPSCTNWVTCIRLREQAIDIAYGDSGGQALTHPCALQSWARWLEGLGFCPCCKQSIMTEYHRRREEIWTRIGEVVGVSPWPPNPDPE